MQIGIDGFAAAISDPATGITLRPVERMQHLLEEIELADKIGLVSPLFRCTIVAQLPPNRVISPNLWCNLPSVSCWFRTPGVWNRVIAKPLYGLTPVPRVRIPPSPP
jgi:hypothetical protein